MDSQERPHARPGITGRCAGALVSLCGANAAWTPGKDPPSLALQRLWEHPSSPTWSCDLAHSRDTKPLLGDVEKNAEVAAGHLPCTLLSPVGSRDQKQT